MTDAIHERLRDWLVASANGSLSLAERDCLTEHLAECATCRKQASEPVLVEELLGIMERHRQFPAGIEERVLARLRQGSLPDPLTPGSARRAPLRLALRGALALLVGILLALRTLNLRWSPGTGWANRVWVTVSQFLLRQPEYALAELGADHEGLLASCHQLTSHLVGALLWVLLFVLLGQVLVGLWPRRRGAPPLPQIVPPQP